MRIHPLIAIPTDSERVFLDEARRQLAAQSEAIHRDLRQLDDEEVVRRFAEESSSIARLVLNLCGELDHKIVSVVGGLSGRWDRPDESAARGLISRDALLARLDAAVERADAILAVITPDRLREARRYPDPGRMIEGTVLTVIFQTLVDLAGHTQEIALLTWLQLGDRSRFESSALTLSPATTSRSRSGPGVAEGV